MRTLPQDNTDRKLPCPILHIRKTPAVVLECDQRSGDLNTFGLAIFTPINEVNSGKPRYKFKSRTADIRASRRRYVGLRISRCGSLNQSFLSSFHVSRCPGEINQKLSLTTLGSTVLHKRCREIPRPTMRDRRRIHHGMTSTIWKLSRLSVSSKYYPIRKIDRDYTILLSTSLLTILFLLYCLSNTLDRHIKNKSIRYAILEFEFSENVILYSFYRKF